VRTERVSDGGMERGNRKRGKRKQRDVGGLMKEVVDLTILEAAPQSKEFHKKELFDNRLPSRKRDRRGSVIHTVNLMSEEEGIDNERERKRECKAPQPLELTCTPIKSNADIDKLTKLHPSPPLAPLPITYLPMSPPPQTPKTTSERK
jgi:hypothetical protein